MIQSHVNTLFNSISYRIEHVLVDPGDEWEGFENIETVLLTHAHFDHIYGLNRVVEMNPGVKIYTNEAGQKALFSDKLNMSRYHETPFVFKYPRNVVSVKDGEEIDLGDKLKATPVFTPGHNPSCISWLIGDCLFTGDSYIPGIKTITNLPGADKKMAIFSEEKLKEFGEKYKIFPGHKIEI